jgi:hypothetical protein
MRWSEAGYLSQFVLTHALRQVSVSLIFDVRHSNHNMKQVTRMCATGSRCASAHLLRPAGDQKREVPGLLAGAKVERLASAVRFAPLSRPASGCDAQPSLIAYRRYIEPPPTASGYVPHATPNPVRLGRSANSRMVPARYPNQKTNQSPNQAMEPTPANVTIPAKAGLAPFASVAHLRRWAERTNLLRSGFRG